MHLFPLQLTLAEVECGSDLTLLCVGGVLEVVVCVVEGGVVGFVLVGGVCVLKNWLSCWIKPQEQRLTDLGGG